MVGDSRRSPGVADGGAPIALRLTPVAAAGIVLPVALSTIDNLPVGVMHDDGMYVVLAKALATGQGYRWINVPGSPPATHYPPGYPALLSLVWRIFPAFPANVVAFKTLNAMLLAAVAATLVVFAQRILGFSARTALIASVVGCLAVPTLVLSTVVMSETLFLALLVPTLLYADTLLAKEERVKSAVVLGVLCGALLLVRTHGIAVLAAVVIALLLAKRPTSAAIAGGVAILMLLPWQIWQSVHRRVVAEPMRGDYESYGAWLAGGTGQHPVAFFSRTIATTTRELFATVAGTTASGLPTFALRLIVAMSVLAFLALGVVSLRNRGRVTMLFFAVYLAIVILWPFTPGRFLWGIWPLVVLLFVAGAGVALASNARVVAAILACLVILGSALYTVRGYRGQWWSSIGRQTASVALPTVVWASQHTRPTDVLSTNAELMVYLYTGRQAVPATTFSVGDYFALPSAQSRADALRAILQAYRIDVVAIIANDSLEAAARRMAAEQPPAFALVDSVPHGLIFSSRRSIPAR